MKLKTILINSILFVIFYVIGDLVFSNFIFTRSVDHKCYIHINEGKFYKLRKNCFAKMRIISTIDPYKVYTNEKGQRYSGRKINKRPKNIVFLGDSQTFGVGNDWDNTFTGVIENKTRKYNVFNLGVPSYSPTVYSYVFDNFISKNKINIHKVYVLIDLTDIADESNRWKIVGGVPELNEKKIIDKSDFITKFKRENLKGVHLISTNLRFFLRKLKKGKVNNERYRPVDGNPTANFIYKNHQDIEDCNSTTIKTKYWKCGGINLGLKKTEQEILRLSYAARNYGSEFYIIIMPWPDTLNFGQKIFNWENYTSNLCKKSSCDGVINLFREFENIKLKEINWLEKIYLKDDIHLTPLANKIVAEKIINESF